jgi:hypothetical protein
VTRDRGRVKGLLSLQCEKATLPASASKSSKSFPVRTFPNASMYKSRRFAGKEIIKLVSRGHDEVFTARCDRSRNCK